MTPEQEQAIIAVAEAGLDAALAASFERLMALIRDGTPPREAVQTVMDAFTGTMAETLATALSGLLGAAVGTAEVLRMDVGLIPLSRKLYAQAQTTSDVVAGIVRRHAQGFLDARGLALELFEGYAFRPPEAEPLKMAPSNPRLPQYMREALLSDDGLAGDMQRAFARIQARGLTTGALNAAYNELLDTLDTLEAGKGSALLERRMRVAFFERMRYFANRIATTELHRAYALAEARRILDDQDVDFVQIRRAPGQQEACICDLYAGRDQWGKGPGVYPKARAPVPPYHPHCLPGDALITAAGRVTAVSKRWFDGDVVVIATASGKRLTATVNHPVLTRRGWLAAGLVDVGDEVVARVDAVAVGGGALVDDQHQDVPASIAEVVDAFLGSREVAAREVPLSAEDFHGDGVGSDVAVIGADRQLWNRVDAAGEQIRGDQRLQFAAAAATGLLGDGGSDLALETARDTTECSVCGGSVRAALLRRELCHANDVGGARASALDAGTDQPAVNDVAGDAELARQIEDGSTGEVFGDKVLIVERVRYAGHVYNLETDRGHYTANGIVTHNCRCTMAPRLDLTDSADGKLEPEADVYFLRRLSPSIAGRIVGSQGKLDAVMRGVPLPTVVNAGRDPAYWVRTAGEVVP